MVFTTRQAYLYSILAKHGGISTSTFDERLVLQKRVLLMSAAGIDLGYRFNWYLRCPYCPGLTRDAFTVTAEPRKPQKVELPPIVDQRISELERTLGGSWSSPDQLELLTSVYYLQRTMQTLNSKLLFKRIKAFKQDRFSERQVEEAIATLKSLGVLENN